MHPTQRRRLTQICRLMRTANPHAIATLVRVYLREVAK